MDILDRKIFSDQVNNKTPLQEAKTQIPSLAQAKFEMDYVGPLNKTSHRPRCTVQLRS